MVVTLGQQYNIGEKPTVILYTYINRHARTPEKQRRQIVHHQLLEDKYRYSLSLTHNPIVLFIILNK